MAGLHLPAVANPATSAMRELDQPGMGQRPVLNDRKAKIKAELAAQTTVLQLHLARLVVGVLGCQRCALYVLGEL